MKTLLNIEGMSCQNCARHVKEALEGVAGVSAAKVDLKKATASVDHADSVSLDALKEAVADAGYEVTKNF
jgi:copper chaperone CopZ